MLKCPACGRSGGPFRLRSQIAADNQVVRAWACPCSHAFFATAGAERLPTAQAPYTGFTMDWNGRQIHVRLLQITKRETTWKVGPWTIAVTGPPSGPGTRFVALWGTGESPAGEWRLEASWNLAEVTRRLKAAPLPPEISPEALARILVRVLS